MRKFLTLPDLRVRGIKYSRQHLDRLAKANKFPKPAKASPGGRANVWDEDEISRYQEDRIAERDAKPRRTA